MDNNNDPANDSAAIGRRVQTELARRRLSRQALADQARISLSTLEKALAGKRPFTLATTIRLEQSLDISLRGESPAAANVSGTAPASMGAYARAAVDWIEGRYLTLRPSFETADAVYAYTTTIRWIDAAGHLGYAESQRLDAGFQQTGFVSMPSLSGHIYLVTNESGQYRLMMLGRPSVDGTLYGILSTLKTGTGSQLIPVACPVVLSRLTEDADPALGVVASHHASYPAYRAALDRATSEQYAHLLG